MARQTELGLEREEEQESAQSIRIKGRQFQQECLSVLRQKLWWWFLILSTFCCGGCITGTAVSGPHGLCSQGPVDGNLGGELGAAIGYGRSGDPKSATISESYSEMSPEDSEEGGPGEDQERTVDPVRRGHATPYLLGEESSQCRGPSSRRRDHGAQGRTSATTIRSRQTRRRRKDGDLPRRSFGRGFRRQDQAVAGTIGSCQDRSAGGAECCLRHASTDASFHGISKDGVKCSRGCSHHGWIDGCSRHLATQWAQYPSATQTTWTGGAQKRCEGPFRCRCKGKANTQGFTIWQNTANCGAIRWGPQWFRWDGLIDNHPWPSTCWSTWHRFPAGLLTDRPFVIRVSELEFSDSLTHLVVPGLNERPFSARGSGMGFSGSLTNLVVATSFDNIFYEANVIPSEVWHAHASWKCVFGSGTVRALSSGLTRITNPIWEGSLLACFTLSVAALIAAIGASLRSSNSRRVSTPHEGRHHVRWLRFIFLCAFTMGLVNGSEDEAVRASLRQRAQATANAADPWQARWQWVYHFYGLPQPALGGHYSAEIHRAERPTPWISPSFALTVWQNRDAVMTLQSIAQVWYDVAGVLQGGPMWQFHEAHGSIRQSLVLNEGARHFLLLTYAEERAHLGEAAIFLEIVWNGRGPQDTAVTIPWFPQQISSMGILQRAGLLDSCTLSHRCDIAVDGSYLGGPATALRHGSFVQIEVYPCSPAISDEEEERPQALPAILTPSMSTPTSSDSTSDLASTSGTSEHAGPDDYTSVIHLFRPASHGRPTHIHALTPPGTRSWRTSVFSAWPRLRYDPWQCVDVHRSLYDDYPQQDEVTFRVVIAQPDLPSPLHVIPLVVIHWRDFSFFRAITLPRFATTGHVLAAFGLVPFCGVDQEHCPMFHNGDLWSVTERQTVDHGDYIRVAPRMVPTDGFAEHVAQVFNQDDDLHRWQYIDLVGTARLRGDSSQAASTLPGPCPVPRVYTTTDLYWIAMGWLMSIGTFLLLGYLCSKERHLPPCALRVVSRRYRLPRTSPRRGPGWVSTFLPVLLLSQHCHGSTGLQLRPDDTQERTSDPMIHNRLYISSSLSVSDANPEPYMTFPNPWYGLPPPENTREDILSLRSCLTQQGRIMLSFLEFRCSIHLASPAARSAFGLAGPAVVETTECPLPPASNRPIPTPARAMKLPPDITNGGTLPRSDVPPMTRPSSSLSCHIDCSDRDLDDLLANWDSDR